MAHKGWLFPQDVYIPLQTVARNDADGVYLNLYKEDIQNQDWSAPPAYDTGAATAATGTMTTGTAPAGTLRVGDVATETDDVRVPAREEELVVGKEQRELGRVHLHKDVVEEQQTLTAPVTREEVRVERTPVQGAATEAGPDAFTEQDIEVPVMGESWWRASARWSRTRCGSTRSPSPRSDR
ncbi:MAG TPA: YsnF/AvaK domain-containing protein [Chloroflexota bacterium]|nr:YsnF/AvaK domain-containing protein [Chloroflexota bacterium]